MNEIVLNALQASQKALNGLIHNQATIEQISRAGKALASCFQQGGRAYSCGNGGSMCDAMHFAEELSGRFRNDRPAVPAIAISDPSHITCTGNDYGFEYIFSRYIEALG